MSRNRQRIVVRESRLQMRDITIAFNLLMCAYVFACVV
jgi:hypothetical protein